MSHAYTCPKCGKLVPWLIEKDGVLVCGACFKGGEGEENEIF